MSDFSKYKKIDLSNALKKLGEPTLSKDTKKILVDKLDKFIQINPNQLAHVHQFLEETGSGLVEGEEITIIEDESPKKGIEVQEEDSSDEEDSEDEESSDEDVVEVEDDEESDKDYQAPPPLNLKEYVIDPIINKSELFYDKFYEINDLISFKFLEISEKIRDQLSSIITLNILEISLEFLIFIYNFIKIVPINKNSLIHQFFHDNFHFISESTYPSIELENFLSYKSLTTFSIWLSSAIILPGLLSYFINFTSRIIEIEDDEYLFRIHTFDPFIFTISKILIYYFIGQSSLINFSKSNWIWSSIQNRILMNLGLYNTALASTLGTLPYIFGAVNLIIALYAQFEEY